MLNYHPDKPAYSEAAHDNFLTDPQWLKGVGLLEKFGLSLELHVLPRQMLRSVLRHAPPSVSPGHVSVVWGRGMHCPWVLC